MVLIFISFLMILEVDLWILIDESLMRPEKTFKKLRSLGTFHIKTLQHQNPRLFQSDYNSIKYPNESSHYFQQKKNTWKTYDILENRAKKSSFNRERMKKKKFLTLKEHISFSYNILKAPFLYTFSSSFCWFENGSHINSLKTFFILVI